MILKRPIHVARSGRILGEFSSSDLAAMLESAELLPNDLCYIEHENLWVPVADYVAASSLPKFQPPPASEAEEKEDEVSAFMALFSTPTMVLLGWVLFLIVCAVGVGLGVKIYSLTNEVSRAEAESKSLKHRLQTQEQEYRELLTKKETGEDPSTLRGKVILQSENGEPILMPDFVLRLYPRQTIEAHLQSYGTELSALNQTENPEVLAQVLNTLPPPLAETSTNAIGEYEFTLLDDSEYVIHSSMSIPTGGKSRVLLWFLGVSRGDAIGLPVNVTDWNRVGNYTPELMIVPGR